MYGSVVYAHQISQSNYTTKKREEYSLGNLHYKNKMSTYLSQVLDPFRAAEVGVPDMFPRKSAVFKMTTQGQIKSSAVNGHVCGAVYPQSFCTTGNAFWSYVTNGASNLNVSSMPALANLTYTSVVGTDLSAYYSYVRLIGCGVKLTYIGAEQTAAGELCISFGNNNVVVNAGAGTDAKSAMRDMQFYATGRAESIFEARWIPQDNTDLELKVVGDGVNADKTGNWGIIQFCGTGFPLDTFVYQIEISTMVEGLVVSTASDYIPQHVSNAINPIDVQLYLKSLVQKDPRLVCRSSGENWTKCGGPRVGGMAEQVGGFDGVVSETLADKARRQSNTRTAFQMWERTLQREAVPGEIYLPPDPSGERTNGGFSINR
jgi:hypothetical protein